MTTPDMSQECDGFANALGEYLEGDASDAVRAAVEAHAQLCAPCATLLADLNDVRAGASSLPQLTPSRDLWSGIAGRIDAPVIPMGIPGLRSVARRTWARPALAAAALVAVTAGITHYLTRASLTTASVAPVATISAPAVFIPAEPNAEITSTATTAPSSARPSPSPTAKSSSNSSTVRLAGAGANTGEPVLDNEINKLRRIVNERRAQLDPKTIAVLEQSMAVIDSAIAQSRAALRKDPASGFLATQLNRSLEKKVDLLRTATLLPASD